MVTPKHERIAPHPAFACLKQRGYTVIEAKDGPQAIDAIHKHGGSVRSQGDGRRDARGWVTENFAKLLAQTYPKSNALFVSGYSEQVVQRHKIASVHAHFLQNRFRCNPLGKGARGPMDQRSAAAAGGGGVAA